MILIANIIDFLASMVQVGSGVLKSKSKILISQGGTFAAITTFTNLIALISMIKDKKQEE